MWFMRDLIELITHGLRLEVFCSIQRVIYVLIAWRRIGSFINIPYSIKSHPDSRQSTITCTPLVIMNFLYPTISSQFSIVCHKLQNWQKIVSKHSCPRFCSITKRWKLFNSLLPLDLQIMHIFAVSTDYLQYLLQG